MYWRWLTWASCILEKNSSASDGLTVMQDERHWDRIFDDRKIREHDEFELTTKAQHEVSSWGLKMAGSEAWTPVTRKH